MCVCMYVYIYICVNFEGFNPWKKIQVFFGLVSFIMTPDGLMSFFFVPEKWRRQGGD